MLAGPEENGTQDPLAPHQGASSVSRDCINPHFSSRTGPDAALAQAVVETLAYADIFDYPLTVEQICRYLVRTPATPAQVKAALSADPWLAVCTEMHGRYVCLRGRSQIVTLREARERYSGSLWRTARRLATALAHLPFVRMVAVAGSLSMDNVRSAADDIDAFIVTAPGRVWLTRALVVGIVRAAALARVELCPNYLVSADRLVMAADDLFTAHELAQMVPLYGRQSFVRLLAANHWLEAFFPNAEPLAESARDLKSPGRAVKWVAEQLLRGRLGDSLEARTQRWKLAGLREEALAVGSEETILEADVCKGHMSAHGRLIRDAFASRRAAALALCDQVDTG